MSDSSTRRSERFREKFKGWAATVSCLKENNEIHQTMASELSGFRRDEVFRINKYSWVPPEANVRAFLDRLKLPQEEWLEAAGYPTAEPRGESAVGEELRQISRRLMDIARELIQKEESE